jgi:hypothetical protein
MQGSAQAQRTGPDHHNIGIHQAIVPQPACRAGLCADTVT